MYKTRSSATAEGPHDEKFVRRKIDEIVRYSRDQKTTKFRLPLKLSLLRGSRPKSARASPQHFAHNVPDFIQIGSLSAKL